MTRVQRLWRWLRRHATVLPKEPETTQAKQVENRGLFLGFRWWF